MADSNDRLIQGLFATKAVRVCPQDKPFWYTSGKIGPYYVNTHFLYGSEEKANDLLQLIDAQKSDVYGCPAKVLGATEGNYSKDSIYSGLIDDMCHFIENKIGRDNIDYISGGERRDWFFSLIIAKRLNKPHITIYKDLKSVISSDGPARDPEGLQGKKVLHIADLITEASSYERAWLPALRGLGCEMKWSLAVIDRQQGGAELLKREGVQSFAMVGIDEQLFNQALQLDLINENQHSMIAQYIHNPDSAMKAFIKAHPEFMENALNSDPKTIERAKLCLEKKFYA